MLSKLKMSQETFNARDTVIKVIGIFAQLDSSWLALPQYQRGSRKRV